MSDDGVSGLKATSALTSPSTSTPTSTSTPPLSPTPTPPSIIPTGLQSTEQEIVQALLNYLPNKSNGAANLQEIFRDLPRYIQLTAADWEPARARRAEKRWHSRVRNIAAHANIEGNPIRAGILVKRHHLRGGGYQLAARVKPPPSPAPASAPTPTLPPTPTSPPTPTPPPPPSKQSTSARLERGRLITVCAVCGSRNAPFGYGASRYVLGEYYCGAHRPDAR